MSMYVRNMMLEANDGVLPRVTRRPWEREEWQKFIEGESMTQQSHKDLTDINNVIQRYDRTGQLPMPRRPAQEGDVSALNRPLGELIVESRERLDAAGKALDVKQKAERKAAAEQAAKDKAELEEFRKLKAAQSPPSEV